MIAMLVRPVALQVRRGEAISVPIVLVVRAGLCDAACMYSVEMGPNGSLP
jgi:hypothetical protein